MVKGPTEGTLSTGTTWRIEETLTKGLYKGLTVIVLAIDALIVSDLSEAEIAEMKTVASTTALANARELDTVGRVTLLTDEDQDDIEGILWVHRGAVFASIVFLTGLNQPL